MECEMNQIGFFHGIEHSPQQCHRGKIESLRNGNIRSTY